MHDYMSTELLRMEDRQAVILKLHMVFLIAF